MNNMNKLSLILLIRVIRIAVTLEYDVRCPVAGEWRFRGRKFDCGSTQYVCLLHSSWNSYQESCNGLDYSSIGSKLIFEPYFNKALCSFNRYQPFYFSTDGSSECVYQKSFCNERGQYVFYKGSLETDTTCGCDLSSGYEFVSKPKNTCYCIPSEEDCSCHKLPCYAKDEQCPLDDDVIKTRRKAKDNTLITANEDRSNNKTNVFIDGNKSRQHRLQCVYLTTSLLGVLIIIGSLCCLYDYIQQCSAAELNERLKKQEVESEKSRIQLRERKDYLEAIINGTEVRRFVKVCVLGNEGAGKSSLVHRLLGGKHPCKQITEGLDIVKRCHIKTSDGKWIVNNDAIERQKKARRTLEAVHLKVTGNPLPKEETIDLVEEMSEMEKHLLNTKSESESGNMISGGLVECGLWDFTGQKTFYPIHQSFFTLNSIYLIVADMSGDITVSNDSMGDMSGDITVSNDSMGAAIKFWFDTVHCLCDPDSTKYGNGPQRLNPSIIMVFTNADKYSKTAFKKRKIDLSNQLDTVSRHQIKYSHLRKIFFLSNTTDNDVEFEELRLEISTIAREMDNWGEKAPFEWILLENSIEKIRNEGKNVISFDEMDRLAEHLKVRTLDLFLRFQHHVGNILCFKDIPDFIILNPKYLVYAFWCLVPIEPSRSLARIKNFPNYNFIRYDRDKLIHKSWIPELLNSASQNCKDERLWEEVMEKFDILVKIDKTSEYLTCITPSNWRFFSLNDVWKNTYGQKINSFTKTSWLCLTFEFLPPAFFQHVFAWLIRKYNPSNVQDEWNFCDGICIFDIDHSECNKLLLIMFTDTIALQYLWLEDHDIGKICSNIRKELITTVLAIEKRYKLKVSYALRFACREADRDRCKISNDQLKRSNEDICLFHGLRHESEQICLPWLIDENQM